MRFDRAAWWFVAPALLVIAVFFFFPILAALLMSPLEPVSWFTQVLWPVASPER